MATRDEWTGEAAQALGYGVGSFAVSQWFTDLSSSDSALVALLGAAAGAAIGVARVIRRNGKLANDRE